MKHVNHKDIKLSFFIVWPKQSYHIQGKYHCRQYVSGDIFLLEELLLCDGGDRGSPPQMLLHDNLHPPLHVHPRDWLDTAKQVSILLYTPHFHQEKLT